MATHTSTASNNTVDWNKVLRVTFRVIWWLLKTSFKVALFLGSLVLAFFALFSSDEDNEIIDRHRSRGDAYWNDLDTKDPMSAFYDGHS